MSKPMLLSALMLYICVVGVCDGQRRGCTPPWKRCFPCEWKRKEVTLVARNVLREPTFEEKVTLECTHSKTLFYMMMEAADADPVFRFSAKYFNADLGFFVEAINGLVGNYTLDQTWWQILDGNNQSTPVGVSSYRPSDGETVTFNFTQSAGH